jgi:hypothetical protein
MKKVVILFAAVIVAYAGYTLAGFADADDAPGGVVIGWLLVLGAVGVAVRALLPTKSAN